jgi:hypothetical protein
VLGAGPPWYNEQGVAQAKGWEVSENVGGARVRCGK